MSLRTQNHSHTSHRRFEDQDRAPDSDDDFVQEHPVHTMRTHKRQNKRSLLNEDEDDNDDQGSRTSIATITTAKGKEKIESQDRSLASKTTGIEDGEEEDGIATTTPEAPWSLSANKDSVLVLGEWNDEDSYDVHNDDDDFWPDRSCGSSDSSEGECADETEIGGTRVYTVPVMRQACESNQYGEMLGRAAEFGKRYLAPGDQERQTKDTFRGPTTDSSNSTSNQLGSSHNRVVSSSARDIPGTSLQRAVSSKTVSYSDSNIPGIPSASSSRCTTTTTNDGHQEMRKVQKRFRGSRGSGEKSGFNRVRSHGKTSKKAGKGQMSDPDDDNDSTTDPGDSENDDAPNIEMGFGIKTRVFMADGTTKRIKNIQPGEYVLGSDRMPRLVIGTSIGRSPMIQVRELTQNAAHVSDSTLGLVTFTCTPKQSLRLATAQVQGIHVRHDVKRGQHTASFHRLKRVHESLVVVHSTKTFQDTKPNAKQEADAFAHNRSKDVIYWNLPKDRHHLVSKAIQLQTYHLTAAIDFGTGRLRYHALMSGFTDDSGMQEKLAYIWGTWIGDGNSTRTSIAVNLKDREQIARIKDVCYGFGLEPYLYKQSERQVAWGCMGGEVSIISRVHKLHNYLMTFLRRLGLGKPGSKYVPQWLRKESISVREHFLAGLIDSDGCCTKQGYSHVSDSGGATPHDRDKANQRRIYRDVTIATIYYKVAEGVFVLARSLGILYSACHIQQKSHGQYTQKPICHIKLQPCSALTNILSLCAVDTKWQPAPVKFTHHHIEYRYVSFNQDVVTAIHKLPDLPSNPEETRALMSQLDYPTLTLLATRYHNFDFSRDQIHERLSVPNNAISAYFANKGDNDKLKNFMRDQVFEKLPIEVIHALVLLARNPSNHHAVALTLDPATDGLFVLGNNAVVTSKQDF
ncbi:H(+)-transporting V1 sector ATPase subunit A [Podila verticillata]|nr:H(+)-transporting V1 sector ATPase subunit A [Podila verticillata]